MPILLKDLKGKNLFINIGNLATLFLLFTGSFLFVFLLAKWKKQCKIILRIKQKLRYSILFNILLLSVLEIAVSNFVCLSNVFVIFQNIYIANF